MLVVPKPGIRARKMGTKTDTARDVSKVAEMLWLIAKPIWTKQGPRVTRRQRKTMH